MKILLAAASDGRRCLLFVTCLLTIAACIARPTLSQPLEIGTLETPNERFAFAVWKVVSNTRGIPIDGGVKAPVKIVVMTCNDECTSAEVMRIAQWGHMERSSLVVSLSGLGGGREGLRGQRLGAEQLHSIDDLLKHLPDEGALLPPVERRLLVSYQIDGHWKQRIYDRAMMPKKLTELVKHFGHEDRTAFGAWVCKLTVDRELTVTKAPRQSRFTVDPHGTVVALAQGGDALQVYESTFQNRIANSLPIAGSVVQCEFSSNGRFLAILSGASSHQEGSKIMILETSTWKLIGEIERDREDDFFLRFCFSPSAEHLTAWTKDGPVAYETSTCKAGLVHRPNGDHWRQLSSDANSAFVIKETRSPWLWKQSDQSLTCLDENCQSLKAAFSPDGRWLAILTSAEKEGIRLRVWNTTDASLCSELRPYGLPWYLRKGNDETVLSWSPDSVYLIGADSANSFHASRVLHLWNSRTGRHCADLVGSYSSIVGIGFGNFGKSFFAASPTTLCRWDMDDAVKQIKEFESTVSAAR